MSDAESEVLKVAPDKNEVGKALDRALEYASKTNSFAEKAEQLGPHLRNACSWLGEQWHNLLNITGSST